MHIYRAALSAILDISTFDNLWAVLVWAVLVLVYGPFLTYEWAVLDIHVGRFGPGCGPFLPFARAVLVHGSFW